MEAYCSSKSARQAMHKMDAPVQLYEIYYSHFFKLKVCFPNNNKEYNNV